MPQELAQEQLSPHPIATPFLQIPDISQQIRSSPQDAKRGRGGLHGSIDSRSGDGHKSTTQDTRPAKRLTSARILGLANDQHPSRIARGHNSTPAKNSTDTALDSLPTSKSSLKSMVSTHRSTPGYLLPTRASSLRSKPSNYCARSVSDSGPELAKTRTTRTYSDSLKSSNPWNTLISKSHSTSSTQSVSSFAPEDSVSETHPTSNTQNLPMLPLDRAPGIAQRYGLADQHPIYRPGQASGFVQQGNGVVQYPSEPPVERYINHEGKIGVVVSRTHGSPWSHNLIEGIEGPKASLLSLGIIRDLEGRPINPPRRSYTEEDVARMERTIDIMLFDKEVVSAVLEGREHVAMGIVGAKRNDPGTLVWDGGELEVFWVDPGEEFMIHEYDGWESLRKKGEILFFTA